VTTVSAAVINYNGAAYLAGCLQSLAAQTHPCDVTVYDNASTDGSADLVAARFPAVALVRSPRNLGYGGAANRAIRESKGEFVLLLNADVVLTPTFVERLLEAAAPDPAIGSLTGKLLRFPEGQDGGRIDSTGHLFFRNRWVTNRGTGEPDRGQYDVPGEVFGVSGAAACYRRRMLEDVKVGDEYLAESFFVYLEDVDLDWRARLRGWKAWYVPTAVAHHARGHKGRASFRAHPGILRHSLKNHYLMLLRNDTVNDLARDLPSVLVIEAIRALDYGRTHPKAWLAYWDVLRLLPRTLRERRAIQARRTAPRAALRAWYGRYPFGQKLGLRRS
jgi:GT2 family glycosyltransferase